MLASNAELSVGSDAVITGNLRADTIHILRNGTINGSIAHNGLTNGGSLNGAAITPLAMPLSAIVPSAPGVSVGTTDVSLVANESRSLLAGSYRNVSVVSGNGGQKTILTLSGGLYQFASITVINDARIECATACEIRVRDRVAVGNRSYIGPKPGVAGLGSGNVQLLVNGTNGAAGPLGTPHAVLIGDDSELHAYALVPNGTLRLGHRVVFRGKLVGKDVVVGNSDNAEGRQLAIISTNPADRTVREGSTASFEVFATGPGLTYQWQRNGVNIAGATGASYTTPPTVLSQSGARFRVLIINNAGTVISTEATLTVIACTTLDPTCNNDDEDCDGAVDDDVVPTCNGSIVQTCQSGQMQDFQNCVDISFCNGEETCSNGACTNPTDLANYTDCGDGNDCNGEELCYEGQCSYFPHVPLDSFCAAEFCDATTNYQWDVFFSEPGTTCSDGIDANGEEVCDAAGVCYAPPETVPGASCDPAIHQNCDPWTSRASGAAPCPNAPTLGSPATQLCQGSRENQPDRSIFVFLSGICDMGTKQQDGGDDGLISEWSQYAGEGMPVTGEVDGISFGVVAGRGAELAQLIMNDSGRWAGAENPPGELGWFSPVGGEAVFYRIPWPCHVGFNAGAVHVSKKLDTILAREFGQFESDLERDGATYNPRQLFILAHSAGGPLTRLLLANWGQYDSAGHIQVLAAGDQRRENLTTLLNNPTALAFWPADAGAIAPATPVVALDALAIEAFMERSTRIRRHTAGAVFLTPPAYGSPVTRLALTSLTKTFSQGNSATAMLDEAFMSVLHAPGMPFDDPLTYPGGRPSLDMPPAQAGIPVLLVGGRSSEPKVTNEDLVEFGGDKLPLSYPLADRWISEWRWREPLTEACESVDDLICAAFGPLVPVCHAVLDLEVPGSAPNNVSISLRDYLILGCETAVWLAESPVSITLDGPFNPFEQLTATALNCSVLCAAADGLDDSLAAFCDGQCQCVVNNECNLDNPATWWCCPEDFTDDLTDELESYAVDVYDIVYESARATCSVAPCGWLCAGDWIFDLDEECNSCIDGCVAPITGAGFGISQVIEIAEEQLGIEFPGAAQVAAWEDLMSPGIWGQFQGYGQVMTKACELAAVEAIAQDVLGGAEPRFGGTPLSALCQSLQNPHYLNNGWAGDMFAGRLPHEVSTTCGTNLDGTGVDYGAVRENTLNQSIEYVFRLMTSVIDDTPFDTYPWDASSLYSEGADGLFDNDVLVPLWSQLMCSPTDAVWPAPQNLERKVAYANHETGKHTDEVAKLVVEWLWGKYDGDADGVPDRRDEASAGDTAPNDRTTP